LKTKRIKILLLSDSRSFHTVRFAKALKQQNCHVLTVSLEDGEMSFVQLKKRGPIEQTHYLLAVLPLRKIIERYQPNIINAHFASGYGFIAALARGQRPIPIIVNLWGSDILIVPGKSPLHRLKTIYALKKADYIVGDSQYIVGVAHQLTPFKHSEVIPWGIEREFLHLHKKSYSFHQPLKIIVPRAHETVYNNLFIVKALAPLINEGKITLTFPAFGSLFKKFKRKSQILVGDKLLFYPQFIRRDFLNFMAQHDLYLSASRSDSSPASLIEAMALGLLPIAANIEGVQEWLSSSSGFTFTPDNHSELYNIMNKIINSAEIYDEMRRNNRQRVERKAVFEDNIAQQIKIMTRLLRRKPIE